MADIEKLDKQRTALITRIARRLKSKEFSDELNNLFLELLDVSELQIEESVSPRNEEALLNRLKARLSLLPLLSNDEVAVSNEMVRLIQSYSAKNEWLSEMLNHLGDYLNSEDGVMEKSNDIAIQKAELLLRQILA